MKLVLTGASGYIGQRFSSFAIGRGHVVVAATRDQPQGRLFSWMHFDLLDGAPVELPPNTDVVIHLAVNARASTDEEGGQEISAADRLIEAAGRVGARMVFVSSQTARLDAPTVYGRTKWRIEQKVLASGGCVIRPGQVYGGVERGLFGVLSGTVRKLPLLPDFLPAPMIQPIHVDDLVAGLMRVAEQVSDPPGVLCLAATEPISFVRFLAAIAKWRLRCKRFFFPVPVVMARMFTRLAGERRSRFWGLSRLDSLFDLPLMETAVDLGRLGITLRSLEDGMHCSGDGRRRRLLQEGKALLRYLLKESPSHTLLRRYVRAIEHLRGGTSLRMASLFVRLPVLLALLDGKASRTRAWGKEFNWRLDAASALAEATPQGARRFLGIGQGSWLLTSLMRMSLALVGELFWRLAGILCHPLLLRWLQRERSI